MNTKLEPHIRDTLLSALKTVIDPEIGLNIVDLGLIYDITVEDRKASISFTLTTQGCPLQFAMTEGIRRAVLEVASIEDCNVRLVWDPPWNPSMISDEGRTFLSEFS